MSTFVMVIHIITCVLITIVVLMQSGKGAEISATLGGSSQTVFGSSGGANFFTKMTFTLAAIFAVTSLGLTVLGSREKRSVFETAAPISAPAGQTANPIDATKAEAPKADPAAAAPAAADSAKK